MESVILKFLINYGVLGIIAFFYFYSVKKREAKELAREEKNQKMIEKIVDKSLNGSEQDGLITIDRVLINQLASYEAKNIEEHKELKKILTEIKTDVTDLFVLYKNGETIEQKRKHWKAVTRSKISEALELAGEDESLKNFLFDYSSSFSDWIMDSMTYLFENENLDDPSFVYEKLRANCSFMKQRCAELVGDNCEEFFHKRNIDIDKLIDDIQDLIEDPGNDKVSRFFNMCTLFMQKSLTKIIIIWAGKTGTDIKKNTHPTGKGLDDLRRIEKEKDIENEHIE